jgi:hypothetical protein
VGGGPAWDPGVPWASGDCNEATQLIYVVSTAGNLYGFSPPTASFHLLGHLECPAMGWDPLSMAIDRQGRAWVHYWDGGIYRAELRTGQCEATGFSGGDAFHYFGMAFSADPSIPEGERLFIRQAGFYDLGTDPGVRSLGRVDTATLALTVLGEGEGANADLSGTGDGRVYGFVKGDDAAASVIAIDPADGATLDAAPLEGVTIGDAWAFAAWGGELSLFASGADPKDGTIVRRHDPVTGTTTEVDQVGFHVVGAGVSSCAPVDVPR